MEIKRGFLVDRRFKLPSISFSSSSEYTNIIPLKKPSEVNLKAFMLFVIFEGM